MVSRKDVLNNWKQSEASTVTRRSQERRGFLASIGSGTVGLLATTIGLSGTTAAEKPPFARAAKRAAMEYMSEQKVKEAVQTYADDLLVELTRRGHLEEPSVSILPTTLQKSVKQYSEVEDGTVVIGTVDEEWEPKTKIQVKWRSEGQEVTLVVVPQKEKSYAVLSGSGDEEPAMTSLTTTVDEKGDVITQTCSCLDYSDNWYCGYHCVYSCGCVKYKEGLYCSDDDGADCDGCKIDHEASCSCSEPAC